MMDDVPQPDRTTLEDWEAWLAPQVRQVELLGEIPITADECAQLGKVIGLRVRTLGHTRGLRTLRCDYPCALAVYMVAQGMYGYQGGDYWSEVIQPAATVGARRHARAVRLGRGAPRHLAGRTGRALCPTLRPYQRRTGLWLTSWTLSPSCGARMSSGTESIARSGWCWRTTMRLKIGLGTGSWEYDA